MCTYESYRDCHVILCTFDVYLQVSSHIKLFHGLLKLSGMRQISRQYAFWNSSVYLIIRTKHGTPNLSLYHSFKLCNHLMGFYSLACRTSVKSCREQSLDQVARAVCMERINFETGPFEGMSDEGIDLLSSLLERNPVQRATAAEVGCSQQPRAVAT